MKLVLKPQASKLDLKLGVGGHPHKEFFFFLTCFKKLVSQDYRALTSVDYDCSVGTKYIVIE